MGGAVTAKAKKAEKAHQDVDRASHVLVKTIIKNPGWGKGWKIMREYSRIAKMVQESGVKSEAFNKLEKHMVKYIRNNADMFIEDMGLYGKLVKQQITEQKMSVFGDAYGWMRLLTLAEEAFSAYATTEAKGTVFGPGLAIIKPGKFEEVEVPANEEGLEAVKKEWKKLTITLANHTEFLRKEVEALVWNREEILEAEGPDELKLVMELEDEKGKKKKYDIAPENFEEYKNGKLATNAAFAAVSLLEANRCFILLQECVLKHEENAAYLFGLNLGNMNETFGAVMGTEEAPELKPKEKQEVYMNLEGGMETKRSFLIYLFGPDTLDVTNDELLLKAYPEDNPVEFYNHLLRMVSSFRGMNNATKAAAMLDAMCDPGGRFMFSSREEWKKYEEFFYKAINGNPLLGSKDPGPSIPLKEGGAKAEDYMKLVNGQVLAAIYARAMNANYAEPEKGKIHGWGDSWTKRKTAEKKEAEKMDKTIKWGAPVMTFMEWTFPGTVWAAENLLNDEGEYDNAALAAVAILPMAAAESALWA